MLNRWIRTYNQHRRAWRSPSGPDHQDPPPTRSHHGRTHQRRRPRRRSAALGTGGRKRMSVSNSLSGRHWELDQVPAVGDPTHIVQLGTGHRVSAGEGQRRVALQ